jgi:hypothetical protein
MDALRDSVESVSLKKLEKLVHGRFCGSLANGIAD